MASTESPPPTKRHRDEGQGKSLQGSEEGAAAAAPSGTSRNLHSTPLGAGTATIPNGNITSPLHRREAPVYRIAVTGGPCAGKSTFLALLRNTLEERTGVKVYCVPEAATLLVTGGLWWSAENEATIVNQLAVLKTQIALEDAFYEAAKATKSPALIVCDRGVMDGRAYCTPEQYDEIMRRSGYKLDQLRDSRYDAVLHLVTAAIGAPAHYNFDNPARFESVDGAVAADHHLRNMYLGHPRVKLIDNSGGTFQAKLDKAVDVVYEIIGHTRPKHRSRRYLVRNPPSLDTIPVPTARVDIVITVLSGSDESNVKLLLTRNYGNNKSDPTYYFFNPSVTEDGEKTESRHMLSAREYATLQLQRDPNHSDVVKRGVCFTYEGNFFELTIFDSPQWMKGTGMVYVSCDEENPLFPTWLQVDRDTTNDVQYSSYSLSKKRTD
jgi:predicted ATPase